MPGNIIRPPSMGDGLINLALISDVMGLPPKTMTPQLIAEHVMPAIVDTFSDGEVIIPHEPITNKLLREQFGEVEYRQGKFGNRLRELFDGDDIQIQQQADGLIRFAANVLAHRVVRGDAVLPPNQNVTIFSPGQPSMFEQPMVGFDGRVAELARAPKLVVDYGPGLQGRHHIDRQLVNIESGTSTYAYVAIAKGPFINEFLQQYWAARLGKNADMLSRVVGRFYIGREDGIAAASTELVNKQMEYTGSAESVDLVIASGIYAAGYVEVETGIEHAHHMLVPDGTLLIRAPLNKIPEIPSSVAGTDMIAMALDAGFKREKAQIYDTMTGKNDSIRVASISGVFRK